jgi:hypothetical protein
MTLLFADGSRREVALENVTAIAWAPDGSQFAVAGSQPGIDVLSSDGSTMEPIDASGGLAGWLDNQTVVTPALSLTGALDAFDLVPGTSRGWAPAPTGSIGLTNVIGYAPGITSYAYFANDSIDQLGDPMDLIVRDLPSNTRHVLAQNLYPPNFAAATGAWSPDGTHLAVSIIAAADDPRAQPGLWIYAVGGGEPTFVSAVELALLPGSWQPLP